MNDKIHITIENGDFVEATAPIIISASRSTDIPAFWPAGQRISRPFMPSGSSTAWLKGIVHCITLSTSRKCIFLSRTAR